MTSAFQIPQLVPFRKVYIDYGGVSLYQCGVPPPKKNSVQKDVIEAWKKLLDQKYIRRREDLIRVNKLDLNYLSQAFIEWKGKTKEKIHEKMKKTFSFWKKAIFVKRSVQKRRKDVGINALFAWKLITNEATFRNQQTKSIIRQTFERWRELQTVYAKSRRIRKSDNLCSKKKYYYKWKSKYRNKVLRSKEKLLTEKISFNTFREVLIPWWHVFLAKKRQFSHEKYLKIRALHKFRIAFYREQNLSKRVQPLVRQKEKDIVIRMFLLWRRRKVVSSQRRSQRACRLWVKVVSDSIVLKRSRQQLGKLLNAIYFQKWVLRLRLVTFAVQQSYYRRWKHAFAQRQKFNQLAKSTSIFSMFRSFLQWKYFWQLREDVKIVQMVQARVVFKVLMRKVFRYWKEKTVIIYVTDNQKAEILRITHLERLSFRSWFWFSFKRNSEPLKLALKKRQKKVFDAFKELTLEKYQDGSYKAQKFYNKCLLKRYLWMLKDNVRRVPSDERELDRIIRYVNREVNFF